MRVAWFPKTSELSGNPYWIRLQEVLEAEGVEFETSHSSFWLTRRWLLDNRRDVAVLHFHFIQPQYTGSNNRVSPRRLFKFISDLILARLLGYHLVWTLHDLMPTWPKEPQWLESLARVAMAMLAQDVIVHCREAQRLLALNFRRSWGVTVLPLPSYLDEYPNDISPTEARSRLQIIPDRFVYAFIGGIRPNKGLEELIKAFSQIEDPQALLLIAGKTWPPDEYIKSLENLASGDGRILLRAEEIPDNEMQNYLKAADIIVFPFKRVLTSSSVILAMSFGRPVIVPRLGCPPELVGNDAGILYDPDDPPALSLALRQALSTDLIAMGVCAAEKVNIHNWEDLARETLEIYR